MRKNVTILALAMLLLLSACTRGHMLTSREMEVEDAFSVAIPENLVPCHDLHEFAPLQVSDETGGYFLVGIMEPKASIEDLQVHYSLGDYAYFVESTIGNAFDTMSVFQRDTLSINGLPCQTADFYVAVSSEDEPIEVYYHTAVFEGKDRFYQLIGWTHRGQQDAFHTALTSIDQSFCEMIPVANGIRTASAWKGK